MEPLVTIAIPVYKRLDYLPTALQSVAAQTYSNIELIVSDNGLNGQAIPEIIRQHYPKGAVFRQNDSIADPVTHFNQLVAAATGNYFVLLCDDDLLGPGFVAELTMLLEQNPNAAVAVPRWVEVNPAGVELNRQKEYARPPYLSGDAYIRAWCLNEYELRGTTVTYLARTELIRRCGGYAALHRALYTDDSLLAKLALGHEVAIAQLATFYWRVDEKSLGHAGHYREVALACRQYLHFLDTDPYIQAFATAYPARWKQLKGYLREASGEYYYTLWTGQFRNELPYTTWARAAFALPPMWNYYERVLSELLLPRPVYQGVTSLRRRLRQNRFLHRLYQRVKYRSA